MATYSHSRISTFENCPYQYKLRYINKIKEKVTDKEICDCVEKVRDFRFSLAKRKDVEDE